MAQEIAVVAPEPYEILVVVSNERPLPASLLGELLSNLQRDYRRQNRGRTLAVSRLVTGSTWLYLSDMANLAAPYANNAVDIAKGGKAILDFARSLRDAINRKKHPAGELPDATKYRTVETLVKVAAESRSQIKLRQSNADGSSLEVELSPAEAVSIQQLDQANRKLDPPPPTARALASPPLGDDTIATHFADRLQASASSGASDLVEVIAEALITAGGEYLLDQVASQLEARGLSSLAAQLRGFGRGESQHQLIRY